LKKTLIVLLCLLLASTAIYAYAASYRQGSYGSAVREIQTRLKNWGYYNGEVDGIYGSRTTAAVKQFQKNNGLAADGIAGPQTLKAMGISSSSTTSSTSNDVELLARIIAAEARGEPYIGQVAVGAVILNRVEHASFPNTLAGVIYQSGAFTAVDDGQFASVAVTETSRKAANAALSGWDPTGGAIYYYNPAVATSKWIWSRPVLCTIGEHVFCS